ncbi:MFS transporter [Aliiglaciecola sp. M165]|uniref:MFS transporter n=1 Tax=Aliiglaciecola sp. M165 TaxID=2593649 RepID=UPI00117FB157|nr:MFS transporter [Aliiglaciecola sp. M165]TRY32581.1 MFS transporter [Aliiglaciecola sp. M165]
MSNSKAYIILISMMFISMLSMAGIALPYPILAPLFVDAPLNDFNHFLQFPPKILLAIVLAAFPVGALIGSTFLGALSDSYGRKWTLAGSISLSALGYVLCGYALLQQDYLMFVFARFVTGLFSGNVSIARAIAADLHPVIDKTRAFSWTYAAGYVGWLVGPLAGGYLMLLGAHTAFFAATIALMVSAILTVTLISETSQSTTDPQHRFFHLLYQHNSLRLLHHKALQKVFVLALVMNLGLNAFYEFYPVWLVEVFSFSSIQIGHHTAVLTLCMVLASSLLLERIRNTLGKIGSIVYALVLAGCLLLATPFVNMSWILPYFVFMGMLIAVFNGLLPVYFSDRYEQFGQGKLMGLLTITFYLANALIAIIGGIVSLVGATWSVVLGGLILLVSASLLRLFDRSTSYEEARLEVPGR